MGMFDYIDPSAYNLPGLQKRNYPDEWQTKSLECLLRNYYMNRSGEIMLGSDKVLFTGTLWFYGRTSYGKSVEYKAVYISGDLIDIEKVE